MVLSLGDLLVVVDARGRVGERGERGEEEGPLELFVSSPRGLFTADGRAGGPGRRGDRATRKRPLAARMRIVEVLVPATVGAAALAPWCKAQAVYDPGKILLDVALAVALGGDCLADVGMLRAEPALFGPVASDLTV